MRKYNKGEWSELYAICSILNDREIKVADSNLNPTGDAIKVLRLLMGSHFGAAEYDITDDDGKIAIIVDEKVKKTVRLDKTQIEKLFKSISAGSGHSFSVPIGDFLMSELSLDSFKADSYQKSDLDTVSIMPQRNTPKTVGFSVKSQIGAMPTLLNASQSTNFIYRVDGFSGEINAINAIGGYTKIKDRIETIKMQGGSFSFFDTENQTFKQNLRMTDLLLPEIIAYMLLDFFGNRGVLTLESASERIVKTLPFATSTQEIKAKIKNFLCNVALGMIPTKAWDGTELSGGCIFVKNDGEIICFTLYDRDEFKDYLIKHTKFETASSSRNKFGKLYRDASGSLFFKLNLDIRML